MSPIRDSNSACVIFTSPTFKTTRSAGERVFLAGGVAEFGDEFAVLGFGASCAWPAAASRTVDRTMLAKTDETFRARINSEFSNQSYELPVKRGVMTLRIDVKTRTSPVQRRNRKNSPDRMSIRGCENDENRGG